MEIYDVIVIGGGASGLTVANVAKMRRKKVLVLEAGARVGKKVLVAGNGKCNLSNENISVENYNNPAFVGKFLPQSYKVKEFFKSIGLVVKSVDGRIYPYSESGNTVLNILRKNILDDICVEGKAEEIFFSDGLFSVNGYRAKNVAVCTGGITSGGIASYGLLKKFGHEVVDPRPVLTPLKSDVKYIKSLAGVRVKCKMTLSTGGKAVCERRGELLFKENGLSGIVSMELSRYVNIDGINEISVDFAPEYSVDDLSCMDKEGLLQRAVSAAAERQAKDRNLPVEEVIKDFIVKDIKPSDGNSAQVTRGGISTDGFDEKLESKLRKGLFACGEVLDVDGDCGGYNLHWAFLSGAIVGENI